MPAALSKTRTPMSFVRRLNDQVVFQMDWESGDVRRTFTFDAEAWGDMGQPETITVTVEPGDLLND